MSESGTASRYLTMFQLNFGKSDFDVLMTRMILTTGLWSSGDLVVRVLSSCGSEVSLTLGRLKSVGEGVDDNAPVGKKR